MRGPALLLTLCIACTGVEHRVLRVCADPNNLPFSNARQEGFENRIVEIVARELDAKIEYTWWAQRRGFVRNTLRADQCDLIPGVPSSFELALTTRPYYRSTYVFVSRTDRVIATRTFDDDELRSLRVGVQLIGDDYTNSPPAHALANRGIINNVVGYSVIGDYAQDNPPARIMDAVREGDIDVAVVWGPLAGWYATGYPGTFSLTPVSPRIDLPFLPFVFDIAMGVRREDTTLRDEIDLILRNNASEITRVLQGYGVPLSEGGAAPPPEVRS